MPTFSYTLSDFLPFTKIRASDFNSKFTDIATFLNGQIGNSNIADNSINRNTKLLAGTANYVVINDAQGKMTEEVTLATSRGGLGFAPTISSATAGTVLGVNDAGDAITQLTTTGATLIEQLANQVSGIQAGEALTANDSVALILNQGTYKVVKADQDDGSRGGYFVGFALANATVTPAIISLDRGGTAWTAGSVSLQVNGRNYTATYATSNDATVAALATAIGTDPDVQSAVVTDAGSNDRIITVTGKGGLTINITNISSAGGGPTFTQSTTQSPSGSSVRFQMFGPMSGFSGLSTSASYYVSTTAGGITNVPSSSSAQYVGQALSSTVLFVSPNRFTFAFGTDVVYVRSHGTSTGAAAGAVQDAEHFNLSSWSSGTSSSAGARAQAGAANSAFNSLHHQVDGAATGGSATALFQAYNKAAWSTLTNRATTLCATSVHGFSSLFWTHSGAGSFGGAAAGTANDKICYKWSGSAWASGTALSASIVSRGCFVVGSLLSLLDGLDSGSTAYTTHETKTTADALSSGTAVPGAGHNNAGASATGSLGLIMFNGTAANITNGNYTWSGSAWSAAITSAVGGSPSREGGTAYFTSAGQTFQNGGQTGFSSGAISSSQSFNGTAFSSATASSNARGCSSAAVI